MLPLTVFADEVCVEFSDPITYSVAPSRKIGTRLGIGELVEIQSTNGVTQNAFYLGAIAEKNYFVPVESAALRRPFFYILRNDFRIETRTPIAPGVSAIQSHQPTSLISITESSIRDDVCGPQTVMACLDHLGRMGLLSRAASSAVTRYRDQTFRQLIDVLSHDALSESPEVAAYLSAYENATTRQARYTAGENLRGLAFDGIVRFLAAYGVEAQVTDSYSKLISHLKSGKPAYISTNVASTTTARPSFAEWSSDLSAGHADLKAGSLPMPVWAPSSAGYRAVYALGILPRATGFGGFIRGHRVIVLDPANARLNVWDIFLFRFAQNAKFILIGPD